MVGLGYWGWVATYPTREAKRMRMMGNVDGSWCSSCAGKPGYDCPDVGKSKRQVKREERDRTRKEILDEMDTDRLE
jgi:hypothetical protein